MDYYEFRFTYDAPTPIDTDTINDVLAAELGAIGFESFAPDADGLSAYIPTPDYCAEALAPLLADFPLPDVAISHTHTLVPDRDWNEEWEKNYFQPVRIGRDCLIRASFHPHEEGFTHTIVIDPRMAFGTGNHATTELMIREMLPLDLRGREVLDMGCGTAVLAILAARKGATRVAAIDIDEWACRNAADNCRLNDTPDIHVLHGGAEQIASCGTFDYIFANINRNILLRDIRYYVPALRTGGRLYLSGFYERDVPAVEEECRAQGLSLSASSHRDKWAIVSAVRDW